MIEAVTTSPLFGIVLCIGTFQIGRWVQKKTGLTLANPLVIAILLCIGVLLIFDIPYEDFAIGGDIVNMMLGPATAVLALNIYNQYAVLKRHFVPVLVGCTAGSLFSLASVLLLCRLFRLDEAVTAALLPKSCTTPIAVGIAESHGGIAAITMVAVLVTGFIGAVCAPSFAKLMHVTEPVAEGLAIGACSHALGTTKAAELGEVQGAMSGIAIGVCGLDHRGRGAVSVSTAYRSIQKARVGFHTRFIFIPFYCPQPGPGCTAAAYSIQNLPRKHTDHPLQIRVLRHQLVRCRQHGARAGRSRNGVCLQHLTRRDVGRMAGHGHHGIHDVRVIVFRHKARAQARDVVPSDVPAADGLALVRLYGNHLYIRVPCLDVFAHARNSAAAAYARNNGVQRAARCLGDVRARYTAVKFSVQVIVEIVQEIAARLAPRPPARAAPRPCGRKHSWKARSARRTSSASADAPAAR